MFEVREVLRLWLMGHGLRKIASLVRCDRKTVTKVVDIAKGLGLTAGDNPTRVDRPVRWRGDGRVGAETAGSSRRIVGPDARAPAEDRSVGD